VAHSSSLPRLTGSSAAGSTEPSVGVLAQSAMADVSGIMATFAAIFFFIALAEFLTWLGLPRWISYLIVFVLLLLLAGVAALVGRQMLKRIEKPARTLETLHDLPDVVRREAPGQRQHDLPTVRNGEVVREDPHARLS
jgi:hypothetical protein